MSSDICYKCGKLRPLVSGGRCDTCYQDDLKKCGNKIAVDKKLIEEVLQYIENAQRAVDDGGHETYELGLLVKSKLEELLK